MSDLIERLEAHDLDAAPEWTDDWDKSAWIDTADELLSEAAAEIASLRSQLEEALRVTECATIWRAVRVKVVSLSISDPAYRAAFNELAEAEDALSIATAAVSDLTGNAE